MNHKSAVALVVIGILCCCACNTHAGIRPSFFVDESAWQATHIVVVSEVEKLDGKCDSLLKAPIKQTDLRTLASRKETQATGV